MPKRRRSRAARAIAFAKVAGRPRIWAGGFLLATVAMVPLWASSEDDVRAAADAPNIVLIVLDDLRASDLEHMPRVRNQLVRRGVTFPNFTTTVPTCCPSRTTFLRGQYAHNHKVGYSSAQREESFRKRRLDRSTVGTWMQDAGYRTGYIGKYLNKYDVRRVPPGWSRWAANFDRDVWARTLNVNGRPRSKANGNPDVRLGKLGASFAARSNKPFFLWQNFNAPHRRHVPSQRAVPEDAYRVPDTGRVFRVPAPRRFWTRLRDVRVPKTPAFNVVRSGMPEHVRGKPRLRAGERRALTREHRGRLASLELADRRIKRLILELRRAGKLDETYVFLTSDNGYHMGERRLNAGKMTPLLTDVRVPLVVRGPGISAGTVRHQLVQNTDLAPTIAALGGADQPAFVDGRSFASLLDDRGGPWRDASFFEGRAPNGTQSPALRFSGATTADGYHYVEYPNGFRELYDLDSDPHQLRNLANRPAHEAKAAELGGRVADFRTCSRESCRAVEDDR